MVMAEMPRRVRSHRLECEARRRFRDLIEDHGWVVRPKDDPDYGVDDEVEVFDGDDATGITFLVQSRGTDDETSNSLRVSIRLEQQNYFRARTDPVLIARYHAPTGRTLAKWFHEADPYPRLQRSSITLSPEDELTPDRIEELATEVRRFRSFRSSALEWPVALVVTSDEIDKREVELAIATVLRDFPGLIELVESVDVTAPYMTVRVAHDRLVVHAGLASFTAHALVGDYTVRDIAAAIVLAAGTVLDSLGHGGRAADLIEASLLTKGVPADPLEMLGKCLGRAGRLDVAMRVADQWRTRQDAAAASAAVLLISSALSRASPKHIRDVRAAAELLEQTAADALSPIGSDEVARTAYLSAARTRFAVGDWSEADDDFMRALAHGPEAVTRDDVLAEVAGAAHEAGDYERAVETYSGLVSDAGREDLTGRLADSLARLGRFGAAIAHFDVYLARGGPVNTVWALTREAVSFLLNSGFRDTERDPDAAAAALDTRPLSETSEQLVERCLAAARADPLFEPAWSELATHLLEEGRYDLAYGPLLVAAVMRRSPDAWARLFIAAHRGGNRGLAVDAVHMGAGDYGDEFHIAVRDEAGADSRKLAEAAEDIDRSSGRWRRGNPPPRSN